MKLKWIMFCLSILASLPPPRNNFSKLFSLPMEVSSFSGTSWSDGKDKKTKTLKYKCLNIVLRLAFSRYLDIKGWETSEICYSIGYHHNEKRRDGETCIYFYWTCVADSLALFVSPEVLLARLELDGFVCLSSSACCRSTRTRFPAHNFSTQRQRLRDQRLCHSLNGESEMEWEWVLALDCQCIRWFLWA